ncbi:MAG: transposase [SAR324 cluster bacterium]|nr:transposase [SAR324 cluster bacterium]
MVIWKKQKPEWMDQETRLIFPEFLTMREVKSEGKILVTSMLNPKEVYRKELAELYKKPWLVEVNLKAINNTTQMGILRCKTPEMVRKEVWVHLLAYNLIRTVMAQAAYQRVFTLEISVTNAGRSLFH